VRYEWAIGSGEQPGQQVMRFTDVGLETTGVCTADKCSVLTDAITYFVTIRAWNAAGQYTEVVSDGVLVDSQAPYGGAVWLNDNALDAGYQSSLSSFIVRWSGFVDDVSGIASYSVGVGTAPGEADVDGFTLVVNIGNTSATSARISDSVVVIDALYYIGVLAADYANNTFLVSYAAVVDSTPPTGGVVNDGGRVDRLSQVSTTKIVASWSGFADHESGILRYEWAIGTSSCLMDIENYTSVGLRTDVESTNRDLQRGAWYFVSVRAFNYAGLYSELASNGIWVEEYGNFEGKDRPAPAIISPVPLDTVMHVCGTA
jgi:hypothetical protein